MFLIFKPIFIIGFGFFVKNILSGNQTPQILWVNSKKPAWFCVTMVFFKLNFLNFKNHKGSVFKGSLNILGFGSLAKS